MMIDLFVNYRVCILIISDQSKLPLSQSSEKKAAATTTILYICGGRYSLTYSIFRDENDGFHTSRNILWN